MTKSDKKVLKTLLDIARTFNSRVHVLTIYKESVYDEEAIKESNENLLQYYLEHFYADHTFIKSEDVEMKNFGLDIWGDENFIIQDDTINVNYASKPSLISITQEIPFIIRARIIVIMGSFGFLLV